MISDKTKMALFWLMWFAIVFSPLVHANLQRTPDTTNPEQKPDFIELSKRIQLLQQTYHYNPQELKSAEFVQLQQKIFKLAQTVKSKDEFIRRFNHSWQQGPFSHVRIAPAQSPAKALAAYLDNMQAGPDAVRLSEPTRGTMRLDINTMMGTDTIKSIQQAFADIAKVKPDNLIIDLRRNSGGAFAVKPLVEHLLNQPLDAGLFVSQLWFIPVLLQDACFRAITALSIQGILVKECRHLSNQYNAVVEAL